AANTIRCGERLTFYNHLPLSCPGGRAYEDAGEEAKGCSEKEYPDGKVADPAPSGKSLVRTEGLVPFGNKACLQFLKRGGNGQFYCFVKQIRRKISHLSGQYPAHG